MERLTSGELVYSGILRTNPNTIVGEVPINGRMCRMAAEYFSVMADVYLILEFISAEAYTCPTPDGRARTPGAARERLARLVCADGEMLNQEQTLKLARYLFEKQLQQLTDALCQVLSGLENGYQMPLAVAGAGIFLATGAGRRLGITILDLGREWGVEALTSLPARAAAFLLAEKIDGEYS
jgi:probable H4MPT-linked C1 transfer pathway protein